MLTTATGVMDFLLLSSQWKGVVAGVLLGVCIAYSLQALSSPSFLSLPQGAWSGIRSSCNHPTPPLSGNGSGFSQEENATLYASEHAIIGNTDLQHETESISEGHRSTVLLALWEASSVLSIRSLDDPWLKGAAVSPSDAPRAPHLQNCKADLIMNRKMDEWDEKGTLSSWILWRGQRFGLTFNTMAENFAENVMGLNYTERHLFPPWVEGADEDNLPMTRRVQQDIWQHQHPKNCQDPSLRFLLVDWETDPGFGIGAQITSMAGMLAIALREKRILVSNYFNRADHEGCVGNDRSRWSCYFFSETSKQCRDRALLLAAQANAWEQGLITGKRNYSSRQIWAGKIPRNWGQPWEMMQPTTEIDGTLLIHHKASDRRWWRAQAVRYLMRFRSEYMCYLLNLARHTAFGEKAAKMVLDSLPATWPKTPWIKTETDIDKFVWRIYKPWVPRPLVSVHVRQGDKAQEMKVVGFQYYMKLAQHLRYRFPHVRSIWLSTEMQEVIEESKLYSSQWDIYFTNVSRQVGNMSMPAYEASLGRELSTNYPLVNFLLAAEADFFIGALGSTWCYLIDGMRTTSGKVMAGYLSPNKDRFW